MTVIRRPVLGLTGLVIGTVALGAALVLPSVSPSAAALDDTAAKPMPPPPQVYVAYTVNNAGFTSTCG